MKTVSEIKDEFKGEGFSNVYEWTDEPNTKYSEHSHKGRVSFYVTKGNILININGSSTLVESGERLDVPVGVAHTAKVGSDGCSYIVGEEIEGDS